MSLFAVRHGRACLMLLPCLLLAACGGDEGGGIAGISLSATARSSTEISLSWSEPRGDVSFSPYIVARADDDSSARIDSTTNRNYLVAGLLPGTRYCFEIRAPVTAIRASNIACATTLVDRSPPPPPSNVSATGVAPVAIEVGWAASSDESGIDTYRVFRDGTLIATASGLLFSDSGLTPATAFCYRISAVDGAGNESAQSEEVCATTLADRADPSTPARLSAAYSDDGMATVAVSWAPSSDDSGIARYTILRDGIEIGDATDTNFTDTSIQADTTYCYSAFATDLVGNSSAASDAACVRTSWKGRSLGAFDAGSAAIALGADGVPRVAYKQRRFNADTFEWRSTLSLVRIGDAPEAVVLDDSYAEDFVWGEFAMDMVLDANGNAHIVHQSNPGAMMETLQYVVRSEAQTDKTAVQSLDPPLRGVDLAIDGSGRLHACIEFEGSLYYGNTTGGTWSLAALDSLIAGARGDNCSIAVDAAGSVHIAYLESFSHDLWYASNASGLWLSERVDQQSGTSTNTSYHTAIATDSAGFAHIAYAHDFAENDMEYATNASGTWSREKVDDAGTAGYAADIVIDSTDTVYVLYEEVAEGRRLHLATREGAWSSFVLSSGGAGQGLSIGVDSAGNLHVVFNDESGELTYLTNRH